jgi:hypothetical protein
MIDQRIAAHEAGHAAGLIFFGRMPRMIRVDNPDVGARFSGCVELDHGDGVTHDLAADWFVAILLGPICEPGRQESWPPTFDVLHREHLEGDVAQLAVLARYLKLDRAKYNAHVAIAYHVADTVPFKELHALLADAVCRVPALTGDQLRMLIGREALAEFEIEE